ncbi:MAG TPA: hypothetical protein VF905_12640, partial [Nitrospirota bacterium]
VQRNSALTDPEDGLFSWWGRSRTRITPPCLPGRFCDCLEDENIDAVQRIYSFGRSLSNTG